MTQTPQRFLKLLQAGDLAFFELISYAVLVFGITKHGKTTLSHFLTNNSLQAYMNKGQVHYRLINDTNKDAKIGETNLSQTQIPNQFTTNIKIQDENGLNQLSLIDNPGQLDSHGIYRVLSNAYFHYRVFSKVQNMKIILVFDHKQFISSTFKQANQVFQLLFRSFSNFKSVMDSLLKSSFVIFTKVDKNQTAKQDIVQNMKVYLKSIQKNKTFPNPSHTEYIKLLVNEVQNSNRLKIFYKAQMGQAPQYNTYLEQINNTIHFFNRPLNVEDDKRQNFVVQKTVDMSNIDFSQANKFQTAKTKQFDQKQCQQFFSQFGRRGKALFSCLADLLVKCSTIILFEYDKKGNSKEQNAKQLEQILIKIKKEQFKYNNDKKYAQKRQKIIQNIQQSIYNNKKKYNFIERLRKIIRINEFFSIYIVAGKDLELSTIKKTRQDFEQKISQISFLFTTKQSKKLLAQYIYNLSRFFNQSIVFYLILSSQKSKQLEKNMMWQCYKKILIQNGDLMVGCTQTLKYRIIYQYKLDKINYVFNQQMLLKNHVVYHPNIIIDNNQNIMQVLLQLNKLYMAHQVKIQCFLLKFKFLEKKFNFLIDPKTRLLQKSIHLKVQLRCMLLFLVEAKQIKFLSTHFQYIKYHDSVDQKISLIWTYLFQIFIKLKDLNQSSKVQTQITTYHIKLCEEILEEMLKSGNKSIQLREYLQDSLNKNQQKINNFTIEQFVKQKQKNQKNLNKIISQDDNDTQYMGKRDFLIQRYVENSIKYSLMTSQLGLKQKALERCYNLQKLVLCNINLKKQLNKAIQTMRTGQQKMVKFQPTIGLRKKCIQFLTFTDQLNGKMDQYLIWKK